MSPQQELRSALDALERVFAGEEAFRVAGCTYCYAERDFVELSGAVELIPEDLVSAVASEVAEHWDEFPRLYRRLTPRILRRVVTGRLHIDEELIATRLLEASWTAWDPPLVAALREVWAAWWRATLATHPSVAKPRKVLALVTAVTGELRPWLDAWTATRTPAADAHLADFVDDVLFEYEVTDLHMGFHDEYHATPELLDWLLNDVRERAGDTRLDDLAWYIEYSAREPQMRHP
ncbi:hypothetical protein [Streptomyces acidiscabies]|uniref:Uncharacterized protein n=1 Tax=Streptomyces acidiscabies TaxID=42234 RepID=A0AAP6BHZ6_9ACTN|nr:hypothetical protein [Streptomyces acidiscabies]MBZ3915538.1 hypothetical protein [Streptomyces acidiscabies]MDX2965098.1 hypothetical protein [Streptomyces acidiscabies]MDX3022533.1 hypothetical protein [Streptomyces acidiscabies]MDX3796121.1 hypothetical protein [Streptomyces acidiscabies]GAV44820.1 hypothetical protein Saa2_07799 [Streptomyces acidiscabies]